MGSIAGAPELNLERPVEGWPNLLVIFGSSW
jgi:hypothetical protein